MLRAPQGGGGGSRPGNVWLRTWRRQFIRYDDITFEYISMLVITWGQGGMDERSREGAGEREGEEFCPTMVW